MITTLKEQFKKYVLHLIDQIPEHERFFHLRLFGHYGYQNWLQVLEIYRTPSGKFNVAFGISGRGTTKLCIEDIDTLKKVIARLIDEKEEEYCEKFYRAHSDPYWGSYHPDHKIACYETTKER